ncbi:MAG: hypothetical protein EXR72_27340 [Myxococcales bacterium]|nr:hypothetical protein [Myxococcales bacterium]
MDCIKCNAALDRDLFGGVEVDLCRTCGGLWLDHRELEQLAAVPPEELRRLRTALEGGRTPVPAKTATACPACKGGLKAVDIGPVHIEYCLRCRGVFLDRAEFDAALGSVQGATVTQVMAIALSPEE